MSTASIIVGFVISTVGFSLFLYGRKQRRAPQLLVGVLQMLAPWIVTDPLWLSAAAVVSIIALRVGIAYGI